jgi:hypothetical protein
MEKLATPYVQCSHCNLPVKIDGEIGKLKIAVPGNHEPRLIDGFALPSETAVCPGSELLGTVYSDKGAQS